MSVKDLRYVNVVDVENSCWINEPTPEGMQSDIIEIGICTVDLLEEKIIDTAGIIVFPTTSTVSASCTKLTTITQEMINEEGIPFGLACTEIQKRFKTRDRTWISYGDYDRLMFERQCLRDNVPYPFARTHINIKNLLALMTHQPREVGMADGLKSLGIELEGTHHRGKDDAVNIAKIVLRLLTAII